MPDPGELERLEAEIVRYRRLRRIAASLRDLRLLLLLPAPLGMVLIVAIALAWDPSQSEGPTALEGPIGQIASLLCTLGIFGGGIFMLATSARQKRADRAADEQCAAADDLAQTMDFSGPGSAMYVGEEMGQWRVTSASESDLELVRTASARSRIALRIGLGIACVTWAGVMSFGINFRAESTAGLSLPQLAFHYAKLVAVTGLVVGLPMFIFLACVRPRVVRVSVRSGPGGPELLLQRSFFGLWRSGSRLRVSPGTVLVVGAHKGELHQVLPNRYETIIDQSSAQGKMTGLDAWRYARLGLEIESRTGAPVIIVDHAPLTEVFRPHFEHGAFLPTRDVPDLPGLGFVRVTDEELAAIEAARAAAEPEDVG